MYWAEQIRTCNEISDLTSHQYFYVYSPLPLYWTAGGSAIFHRIVHVKQNDPDNIKFLYTWARSLSAMLGTLTCLLIYLIMLPLSGHLFALLASLFACFAPIHIQNSHFFTAEIPFTFFFTLFLLAVVQVVQRSSYGWQILAGLSLGLTLLCKYTAAGFFVVLLVCQVVGLLPHWKKNIPKTLVKLVFPHFVAIGFFCLIDPWIFYNFPSFTNTYIMLKEWSSGVRQPLWTSQFYGVNRGLYWFSNLIPAGFGIPILGLSLIGIFGSIYFRSRSMIPVWLSGLVYFGLVGLSFMQYIRYILPLTPILAISASCGLLFLHHWLVGSHNSFIRQSAWISILLVSVGFTSVRGLAYVSVYHHPHTQQQAADWINQNYPAGTIIVKDNSAFSPPLGEQLYAPELHKNFIPRGNPWSEEHNRFSIRLLDVYGHLFNKSLSSAQRLNYLTERIRSADVITFSEEAIIQYSHRKAAYPEINKFYDDLFHEKRDFRLVKTFKSPPVFGPYEWDDTNVELSWRLFDHPVIYVFERKGDSL